jgi:hypothetical protein
MTERHEMADKDVIGTHFRASAYYETKKDICYKLYLVRIVVQGVVYL